MGQGGTTLGPLSAEACAQLVRRRFPEAADSFCAECARVTGGNPLLLNELLQAVATSGGATDDPAAERLHETSSVSLQRSTSLRLSGVGPAGQAVAEAVAVLEPGAPLRRVAALAGLTTEDAAAAADALVRAGVLVSSDPPAFAHPLIQSTVRSAIPDAERGTRHRRAAALAHEDGAGPEQVAAHLIWSTRSGRRVGGRHPARRGGLRPVPRRGRVGLPLPRAGPGGAPAPRPSGPTSSPSSPRRSCSPAG